MRTPAAGGLPWLAMRPLSELTTLRLGGPAGELVEARTEEALVDVVREGGSCSSPPAG